MTVSRALMPLLFLCHVGIAARGAPVVESARSIPVAAEVDVVVAGGSTGAVTAAVAANKSGASVFLITSRPYVGEDLCATQRLWLEPGEVPRGELAKRLYGDGRITTPLRVKAEMDRALLQAGVPYLTGCYPTDLLVDSEGDPAGILMVNRSGRQAIRAKVVIDATRHAVLARQSRARFRDFAPGPREFCFVVVGGAGRDGDSVQCRELDVTFDSPRRGPKKLRRHPAYQYTVAEILTDAGFASLARAEQAVRTRVSAEGIVDTSETLFFVPCDTLVGRARQIQPWPGAEACNLAAFMPPGVERLYVLGAHADVEESAAEQMLRPLELMALGRRMGRAAATEAKRVEKPTAVELASFVPSRGSGPAEVREDLRGLRPSRLGKTIVGPQVLPTLGTYDVVVVGGGTSGAPAGMAAARSGAKTLVVEYLDELGGVGTAGLIGKYWYGLRVGFTKEVDDAVGGPGWDPIAKSEWLRQELERCGADVWFRSFGCGAVVEDGQVKGVVVATPMGRGVVRAKVVVDATGNADLAHAAGAATEFSISSRGTLSVQLAGYPHRNLGDSYNNTCFAMVDDTDPFDLWHLMAHARIRRAATTQPYDMGQLVDSRDRRRVVGEYVLSTHDILSRRTFPDTISRHRSNFDAAAFPDSLLLLIKDMKGPVYEADLPYRCLLPKGLEGILVAGLGTSAERDAMTLLRMQADLQNQGYAAGLAAAMAARAGGRTRRIDVKKLQDVLVRIGNLPARVLTDVDSQPVPGEVIAEAVRRVGALSRENTQQPSDAEKQPYRELAVVVAHRQQAIPLLRSAWRNASGREEKLNYAIILGFLGDPTAVSTLIEALSQAPGWDREKAGWLSSERKTGNAFSPLDRVVMALGVSRSPEAVAPLIAKLKQLDAERSETSHFKAIALALRQRDDLPVSELVEPLTRLLNQLAGNAAREADEEAVIAPRRSLNPAMKELLVAAMLLRCGDPDGLGRQVLQAYREAYNGHFARYASESLRRDARNEATGRDAEGNP